MLAAAELLVQLFNSFSPQVPPSGDREVPAATAQGRKPTTSRRAAGVRISSYSAVTCSFCALVEAAHYNKKAGLKKTKHKTIHKRSSIQHGNIPHRQLMIIAPKETNAKLLTLGTTPVSTRGCGTPRLQIFGTESSRPRVLLGTVPLRKAQTLGADSISLPRGYLSRRVLIKWHNSGH